MDIYVVVKYKRQFASPQRFSLCINKHIDDEVDLRSMAEQNFGVESVSCKLHTLKRSLNVLMGPDYPEWAKKTTKHTLVELEVSNKEQFGDLTWNTYISPIECLMNSDVENVWLSEIDDDGESGCDADDERSASKA